MKDKRAIQKRREAKRAKRKVAHKTAVRAPLVDRVLSLPGLETWTDEEYGTWLAHGVNYLVSNYEAGIWEPLFPDIYEGRTVSRESAMVALHDKFWKGPGEDDFLPEGEAPCAWALQERRPAYIFRQMALLELRKENPRDAEALLMQPHNPVVWSVFNIIRDEVSQHDS